MWKALQFIDNLDNLYYRATRYEPFRRCSGLSENLIAELTQFQKFAEVVAQHQIVINECVNTKISSGSRPPISRLLQKINEYTLLVATYLRIIGRMFIELQILVARMNNMQEFRTDEVMQTFGDLLSHFAQLDQDIRGYNALPRALDERADSGLESVPPYRAAAPAAQHALVVPAESKTVEDLAEEMEYKWNAQLNTLHRGEQQIHQYSAFIRGVMANKEYTRILGMYDGLLQAIAMALGAVDQVMYEGGSVMRGQRVRVELHRLFMECLGVLRENSARAAQDGLDGMMAEIDAFENTLSQPLGLPNEALPQVPPMLQSAEIHILELMLNFFKKERAFRLGTRSFVTRYREFYIDSFTSETEFYPGLRQTPEVVFSPQSTNSAVNASTFQYQGFMCLPLVTAYGFNSNLEHIENRLLVCAPTGTGKTSMLHMMVRNTLDVMHVSGYEPGEMKDNIFIILFKGNYRDQVNKLCTSADLADSWQTESPVPNAWQTESPVPNAWQKAIRVHNSHDGIRCNNGTTPRFIHVAHMNGLNKESFKRKFFPAVASGKASVFIDEVDEFVKLALENTDGTRPILEALLTRRFFRVVGMSATLGSNFNCVFYTCNLFRRGDDFQTAFGQCLGRIDAPPNTACGGYSNMDFGLLSEEGIGALASNTNIVCLNMASLSSRSTELREKWPLLKALPPAVVQNGKQFVTPQITVQISLKPDRHYTEFIRGSILPSLAKCVRETMAEHTFNFRGTRWCRAVLFIKFINETQSNNRLVEHFKGLIGNIGGIDLLGRDMITNNIAGGGRGIANPMELLVLGGTDMTRGISFFNCNLLMKVGMFTADESMQLEGRVRRIGTQQDMVNLGVDKLDCAIAQVTLIPSLGDIPLDQNCFWIAHQNGLRYYSIMDRITSVIEAMDPSRCVTVTSVKVHPVPGTLELEYKPHEPSMYTMYQHPVVVAVFSVIPHNARLDIVPEFGCNRAIFQEKSENVFARRDGHIVMNTDILGRDEGNEDDIVVIFDGGDSDNTSLSCTVTAADGKQIVID